MKWFMLRICGDDRTRQWHQVVAACFSFLNPEPKVQVAPRGDLGTHSGLPTQSRLGAAQSPVLKLPIMANTC